MRWSLLSVSALALTLTLAGLACSGDQGRHSQSEKGDAKKIPKKSETARPMISGDATSGQANATKAAAEAGIDAAHDSSVRASAPASATGNAGRYTVGCRKLIHISKEGMSKAEVEDFRARITDRVQANLNGGGDKNLGEILDDMGVPAYEDLCG